MTQDAEEIAPSLLWTVCKRMKGEGACLYRSSSGWRELYEPWIQHRHTEEHPEDLLRLICPGFKGSSLLCAKGGKDGHSDNVDGSRIGQGLKSVKRR